MIDNQSQSSFEKSDGNRFWTGQHKQQEGKTTMEGKGFLQSVHASDLPRVEIVRVNSDTSAVDAIKILTKHNILSAPIYDAQANKYIGLVDMLDLVTFVVDIYKDLESKGDVTDFFSLLESGERFVTQKVRTIADFSDRNPFLPVRDTDTLHTILKLVGEKRVHRVPVVDAEGNVVNFLTQSALVDYLSKNLSKLGGCVDKTVGEVLLGCKPVVKVNINHIAIEAFKLMVEHKVSAVAVVDDDNHLISNISARDIRTIATDQKVISGLFTPIRNFLLAVYSERILETSPAISCSTKDTLGIVLRKLAVSKVHRVYVVDHAYSVIGVISLSDILSAVTTD